MAKLLLCAGALFGMLGIVSGAFGAHALKTRLDATYLSAYETAVQYQIYHALALILLGSLIQLGISSQWLAWSGRFIFLGTLLFCGSLYLLALFQWRWLGPVTPVGGLFFIIGWFCALTGFIRL